MKPIHGLLVLLLELPATAADADLVVPNNLLSREGNSSHWPFTFQNIGITSRRYQQVYDASQFGFISPAGGYIKEIWFRADNYQNFGHANEALDSVQINFGITVRSPDSLSPVFSQNVGNVYTTVYGPSSLFVSTPTGWTLIAL